MRGELSRHHREVDEMGATKSQEFFTALQNIEREIIAKLQERGVPVTAANFKWNRGAGVDLPSSKLAVNKPSPSNRYD